MEKPQNLEQDKDATITKKRPISSPEKGASGNGATQLRLDMETAAKQEAAHRRSRTERISTPAARRSAAKQRKEPKQRLNETIVLLDQERGEIRLSKAHKQVDMIQRTPSELKSDEDSLGIRPRGSAHQRAAVCAGLSPGGTLSSFYRVRQPPVSASVRGTNQCIRTLTIPVGSGVEGAERRDLGKRHKAPIRSGADGKVRR